jgi:hypothetical protein
MLMLTPGQYICYALGRGIGLLIVLVARLLWDGLLLAARGVAWLYRSTLKDDAHPELGGENVVEFHRR